MAKTKTLHFYCDPGHGWLKIKRSELKKFDIAEKISYYSYQRNDSVYLEEDMDAGTYITALRNAGYEVKFVEHCANKSSKIRSYDSYQIESWTTSLTKRPD